MAINCKTEEDRLRKAIKKSSPELDDKQINDLIDAQSEQVFKERINNPDVKASVDRIVSDQNLSQKAKDRELNRTLKENLINSIEDSLKLYPGTKPLKWIHSLIDDVSRAPGLVNTGAHGGVSGATAADIMFSRLMGKQVKNLIPLVNKIQDPKVRNEIVDNLIFGGDNVSPDAKFVADSFREVIDNIKEKAKQLGRDADVNFTPNINQHRLFELDKALGENAEAWFAARADNGVEWYRAWKSTSQLDPNLKLRPKNTEAWVEINDQLGSSNVMDVMYNMMIRETRKIGWIEQLGSNPERMIDDIATHFKIQRGDKDKMAAVLRKAQQGVMTGRHQYTNKWVRDALNILRGGRAVARMAQLGKAAANTLIDPINSALIGHLQGAGIRSVNALDRRGTKEAVEIFRSGYAEMYTDQLNQLGLSRSRFDGDIQSDGGAFYQGVMKMANSVGRLFGTPMMTRLHRAKALQDYSRAMAHQINSGKKWNDLDVRQQTALKRHSITEDEWNSIGKEPITDGNLFDPYAIEDDVLSKKFAAYFEFYADTAVIKPGVWDDVALMMGQTPGMIGYEIVNSLMQYMQFPVALTRRLWGTKIHDDVLSGKGKAQITSEMLVYTVASIAMGAVIFNLREVVGKDELEDIVDVEDNLKLPNTRDFLNEENAEFIIRSAYYAGAGGMVGDLLMEHIFAPALETSVGTPVYKTGLETLAGPVFGSTYKMIDTAFQTAAKGGTVDEVAAALGVEATKLLPTQNFPGSSILINELLRKPLEEIAR